MSNPYAATAHALADHMEAFVREHPEALELDSPSGLFALGYDLGDHQPSHFQASWAFNEAKVRVASPKPVKP